MLKFGPVITPRLRRRPPQPSNRWHPDERVVRIAGERMYLWRAVDHEGEVFDMLVQPRPAGPSMIRFCAPSIQRPANRAPSRPRQHARWSSRCQCYEPNMPVLLAARASRAPGANRKFVLQ